MNKYDIYIWIKKVIDSCKGYKQSKAAGNLINNFFGTFNEIKEMIDTGFGKESTRNMLSIWHSWGVVSKENYTKGKNHINKSFLK